MISRVAVVVPAADEEARIGACLAAVHAARRRLHHVTGGAVRSRAVVVLDDCRDATAEVVARFADVDTVRTTARCVGAARRAGAAYAISQLRPARELWLASTDADCLVPPDWLTAMVEDARRDVDLVLGTVRPAPGLPPAVESAWFAAHHLREDHPHIHAANLGISARTYLDLGGWRELPAHEDVDLVARAYRSGHVRVRRSGTIPVVTSNRLTGRAQHGFAGYLAGLHAEPEGDLSAAS